MNPQVTAALIAGLVAIIVCIINNFIRARIVQREAVRARSLEILKDRLDAGSDLRKFNDDSFRQSMMALGAASTAIQGFRDALQLVLVSQSTSMGAREALHISKHARNELVTEYGEAHSRLTASEKDTLHKAKELTMHCYQELHDALHRKKYASQLAPSDKTKLETARRQLADMQRSLDHYRTNRLADRIDVDRRT